MSSESRAWVWEQDVPCQQKLILLALAHSGGESHSGALTHVELMEFTRMSRRTVSKAVRDLRWRGLITKNVVRSTDGRGRTFRYSLNKEGGVESAS